jgi:hypothetical protein
MNITDVVGSAVPRGYKVMEQEGRASPEFVRAFEEYLSQNRRLPVWVRQRPQGEPVNPIQRTDETAPKPEG